jgi:PEP-CTERM motif
MQQRLTYATMHMKTKKGGANCLPWFATIYAGLTVKSQGKKMMTLNKLSGKWLRSVLVGAVLVAAPIQAAFASLILTNDRNAIQTDYTIDWANLGGDLTNLAGPFVLDTATVSGASSFTVFSGSTYNADFTATDSVLALVDPNLDPLGGIFSITFATAIQGVGAQVQANQFGGFSGFIRAFNAANMLLGQFAVNGNNGFSGNGSAVFAGVVSSAVDITRIEFASFGPGAAINGLSVDVPEPSTWLMLLIGLGFLTVMRKRAK